MTDLVDRLRRCWARPEAGGGLPDDPVFAGAADLKEAVNEIERLREELSLAHSERTRLAADLATAHKDILPWIELASRRWAAIGVLEYALYRISLGSQNSGTTKESLGKEARAALKEAGDV